MASISSRLASRTASSAASTRAESAVELGARQPGPRFELGQPCAPFGDAAACRCRWNAFVDLPQLGHHVVDERGTDWLRRQILGERFLRALELRFEPPAGPGGELRVRDFVAQRVDGAAAALDPRRRHGAPGVMCSSRSSPPSGSRISSAAGSALAANAVGKRDKRLHGRRNLARVLRRDRAAPSRCAARWRLPRAP